jgi:hypothetical protein
MPTASRCSARAPNSQTVLGAAAKSARPASAEASPISITSRRPVRSDRRPNKINDGTSTTA